MKKIILHIGFHKTGSSAIQEYCNENRNHLASKNLFYPEAYLSQYPGHVDLSWSFNTNPPKHAALDDATKISVKKYYKEQIENTSLDTIVISSEDFSLLDSQPRAIKSVQEYFSNYDINIVAYVREPLDFLFSLYSHAVRSRVCDGDFKKYLSTMIRLSAADFHSRLLPWKRCFNEKSIIVNKYSRKSFHGKSLLQDFFHSVSINYQQNVELHPSNRGIHPWLIKAYIEISKSEIEEISKRKLLNKILTFGHGLPIVDGASYFLNHDDYVLIANSYELSLKKLNREYGIEFRKKI